jgi:hypothetical protein
MKRYHISLYLFCLVFFSFQELSAQELPDEKVEVIKNFEARLTDAQKIKLEPEPEVKKVLDQKFEYAIAEKVLPVDYLPPTIKPVSMPGEGLPTIYDGYIKAGYGYPLSPYLDAAYQFSKNDKSTLLGRLTHHSANDKNIENQRFADNDFLLQGSVLTDYGFAVDGKLNISLDENYFYGYDREDTTFTQQEVQHKLNVYELGLKLYNGTQTQGNVNYWVGLDGYLLDNNFATKEAGLLLDLGITKWFGNHPLTVAIETDLSRLKDTAIHRLNNFYLHPSFSFAGDMFRLTLGGRLASSNEEYYFFPAIEGLLNLSGSNLSLFVGADGKLRKNTYRTLSDYNPYLVPEINGIRNTHYYDFYAGIKGVVSGLEYAFQAGFKPTKDLALFEPDLEKPYMRFNVLYDTVDIIYFKGSIKGELFPNLEASGSIVYNIYNTTVEEKAWYLPELQGNISISYLALDRRLRVKAEGYISDPVPFKELSFGEEPNLLLDVSVGADFFFTERIGAFVHLNNLAANKYRRWYNYPSYGLNVLGGVMVRF